MLNDLFFRFNPNRKMSTDITDKLKSYLLKNILKYEN
jgi:hypothetical protein